MKKEKTISFVMPCFNDGETVERAIESIRDQDLKGIEIVVVNDGSTDNSKQVLDALKESGQIDTLIHFEKNKGACVARNTGAKEATGKYLSFLPADAVLYPGMARVWYDALEEHKDYDFVYGGYRIIDEQEEPVPGNEYLFEPFDPYLLETQNYIDGSFPIRRDAFWKYAEKMNQPDGLWDPNIKSLQDWDFWLSVVKNGGKGIYIQDIFFGTTAPHKGGLSDDSHHNWLERTAAIKKKHRIPDRRVCVTSLGAGWHAKRISYILGADFKQMPSFKKHQYEAIYSIGFYPEFGATQDAPFLNNSNAPLEGRSPAKKIVHFIGSDVWQLYHQRLIDLKTVWAPYFKNLVDEILCEDEFVKKELQELGIEAKVVPLPPAKLYDIRPLPKDFTVAVYLPGVNAGFYRPKEMQEVAKRLPDIKFKFFGNPAQMGKDPLLSKNVEYCGYITDMDAFLSECSAIIRFPIHDGLPISVLEFLLAGRYSFQSVPVMHTLCLPNFNVEECVKGVEKMREEAGKGVNQVASDYWRDRLNHEKYKKTIEHLAGYDPKEYWEARAEAWSRQAAFLSENPERNKKEKENFEKCEKEIEKVFKDLKPKSVLDIGCGDGRWWPILKEWGVEKYEGIDISENLIKAAKLRFPHLGDSFYSEKIEDFTPKEKADVAFTFTCLEHVKEEDMEKAAQAIKSCAKTAVLVEPTNFQSLYYCRSHDYEKYFKVSKKVKLEDKTIFVCDLS